MRRVRKMDCAEWRDEIYTLHVCDTLELWIVRVGRAAYIC